MLDDDEKLGKKPEDSGEELSLPEDDIFAEHELDINSLDDLKAMEDITLGEQLDQLSSPTAEEEEMAIFDDFRLNESDPLLPPPSNRAESEDLLSEQSLGYTQDNTATEILEGFPQYPGEEETFEVEAETPQKNTREPVEDIFESDAFEDINSEPLFDYDPNASTDASSSEGVFANIDTEAGDLTFAEEEQSTSMQTKVKAKVNPVQKLGDAFQNIVFGIIGKLPGKIQDMLPVKASTPAPAMAGKGGGGGAQGSGMGYKQRRLMRLLSMVFMVMLVYSLLRSCIGGSTDKDMENVVLDAGDNLASPVTAVEEMPDASEEMTVITELPTETGMDFEVEEESAEQALGTDISFEEPSEATSVAEEPASEEVAVAVPSVDETGVEQPVALDSQTLQELEDLGLMIPQGMGELAVTLPRNPDELVVAPVGQAGVTSKLTDLESSLMAIDDRLDELNFQMRDERITRIENIIAGVDAPETQAMLVQTLQKMEEIDKKLSQLSELQKEMRALDLEIKSVKSDIVEQTTIVGEQQKGINESLASAKMQQDIPPQMIVQATIPGRAWLRSEAGELLTVIPGDDIPGYGRVISIDAATGTVVMSSRVVFREN